MLEDVIGAVGARYGFRRSDFTLVWDGGEFDASREMHELMIETGDGRRATARLSQEAIGDPWKHLGEVEAAFKRLARRARPRGV